MTDPDTWRAQQYLHHSSLQAAMADEVIALLTLRGDERVLDLGCGDGRISARIAQRLPRGSLLGVDASRDMIAFAQSHADAPAATNLAFALADARALAFEPEFDGVVSFNALHWVPDLAPALRGIRDALKPRGWAQLRLVTQGPVTSLEDVAETVRRQAPWVRRFDGFVDPYLRATAEQVAALAPDARLQVIDRHTRLRAWDFKTREAFFGFCNAGFHAWTHGLPEPEQARFVTDVMEQYLAGATRGADDRFVFRFFYQTDLRLERGAAP